MGALFSSPSADLRQSERGRRGGRWRRAGVVGDVQARGSIPPAPNFRSKEAQHIAQTAVSSPPRPSLFGPPHQPQTTPSFRRCAVCCWPSDLCSSFCAAWRPVIFAVPDSLCPPHLPLVRHVSPTSPLHHADDSATILWSVSAWGHRSPTARQPDQQTAGRSEGRPEVRKRQCSRGKLAPLYLSSFA